MYIIPVTPLSHERRLLICCSELGSTPALPTRLFCSKYHRGPRYSKSNSNDQRLCSTPVAYHNSYGITFSRLQIGHFQLSSDKMRRVRHDNECILEPHAKHETLSYPIVKTRGIAGRHLQRIFSSDPSREVVLRHNWGSTAGNASYHVAA